MAKLKKAVKKKWVEALRSGKYQQGRHALAFGGKYCCLGVLCEVAIESGLELPSGHSNRGRTYGEERNISTLPEEVSTWAFLKGSPAVGGQAMVSTPAGGFQYLTILNDRGVSFDEIADMIEASL
jgi:hypothetical protein